MSDSAADPRRKFELVTNAKEVKRLLHEGVMTFSSAILWTENQVQVHHTHLKGFSEKGDLCTAIPENFNLVSFEDAIATSRVRECFFSISLPSANVFFRTPFAGRLEKQLAFTYPKQVFKVQRRLNARCTIPADLGVTLQFDSQDGENKRISRKMVDLSASGASILMEGDDQSGFKQGQMLLNVVFTIKSREIRCNAEIRHIRGSKVGLLFHGIRAAESDFLAAFVFEQQRLAFSRIF